MASPYSGLGTSFPRGSGVVDTRGATTIEELLSKVTAIEALQKKYPFRAARGGAQSIKAGKQERIKLDGVYAGEEGPFEKEVGYTVPVTGTYYVAGEAAVHCQATVLWVGPSIFLNGAEVLRGQRFITTGAEIYNGVVAGIINAKVGDKIELYTYIGGEGERELETITWGCCLSVMRIS